MNSLSPKAHQLLQRLSAELATKDFAVRKVTPYVREILNWCQARDLVLTGDTGGKQFYFRQELLDTINDYLQLEGGIQTTDSIAQDSLSQAKQGQFEHKSVRAGPRSKRVLVALPHKQYGCEFGIEPLHGYFIDVHLNEIDLLRFKEIIVVENLDCFYHLHLYRLPRTSDSLVIYRGDSWYGGGRAALVTTARAKGMNVKFFADLDAKSMHEAITGLYTHLAVPAFEVFEQKAHKAQWRPQQLSYGDIKPPAGMAPYFEFAKNRNRALLQQWMQEMELTWLSLT